MPHTHPLYNVIAHSRCAGSRPTRNDDIGPRPLNEALEAAGRYAAASIMGCTYTVQPVPGTEPRYRLSCNADEDGSMTASLHRDHNCGMPLPWREAAKLYQQGLASIGNPTHWYGLVSA